MNSTVITVVARSMLPGYLFKEPFKRPEYQDKMEKLYSSGIPFIGMQVGL